MIDGIELAAVEEAKVRMLVTESNPTELVEFVNELLHDAHDVGHRAGYDEGYGNGYDDGYHGV